MESSSLINRTTIQEMRTIIRKLAGLFLSFMGLYFLQERSENFFESILALPLGVILLFCGIWLFFKKGEITPPPPPVYKFDIDIVDGTSYERYLDHLESITESVIRACPYSKIPVLVTVQKIDVRYCSVGLSIYDYPGFIDNSFGKGFTAGNGTAHFTTDTATGFTTPKRVLDEILIQFNWADIPKEITEMEILNQGQMAKTPLIICRFNFGPMN